MALKILKYSLKYYYCESSDGCLNYTFKGYTVNK